LVHLVWQPRGIASCSAFPSEFAQPGSGCFTRRYQLFRVLVADFSKRKAAPGSYDQGLGEQCRWIDVGQALAAAQVSFSIGVESGTFECQGQAAASCGREVGQGGAFTQMHVDITESHQRQLQLGTDMRQLCESLGIVAAAQEADADPRAPAEMAGYPARFVQLCVASRQPQQQTVADVFQIAACEVVAALGRAPACQGDQFAEIAVAVQVA